MPTHAGGVTFTSVDVPVFRLPPANQLGTMITEATLPHVGLLGKAGSGKNAAADALIRRGWDQVAFADELKAMAYDIDPMVMLDREGWFRWRRYVRVSELVDQVGWDVAKQHKDVRRFLQRLGTEGVRDHIGRNTWVELTMRNVTGPSVFTDVRFPNEADAVKNAGGILIRVERPDAPDVAGHISEDALKAYTPDYTVINDGTLDDLHVKIREVVGQHRPQVYLVDDAGGWSPLPGVRSVKIT